MRPDSNEDAPPSKFWLDYSQLKYWEEINIMNDVQEVYFGFCRKCHSYDLLNLWNCSGCELNPTKKEIKK